MKSYLQHIALLAVSVQSANAFVGPSTALKSQSSSSFDTACHESLTVPGMWGSGLNFGKGEFTFYKSFNSFMKPFTDEDKAAFPEVFNMPKGVYEVSMTKPLGIIFEEIEAGQGVFVQDLVEDGLAAIQGKIQPGDVLIGITAIKVVGGKKKVLENHLHEEKVSNLPNLLFLSNSLQLHLTFSFANLGSAKWERRLIPARTFDFDTTVGAIGSNEAKWGCSDVILMFERPGECVKEDVDSFMEFFEPPFGMWKAMFIRFASIVCFRFANLGFLSLFFCFILYPRNTTCHCCRQSVEATAINKMLLNISRFIYSRIHKIETKKLILEAKNLSIGYNCAE